MAKKKFGSRQILLVCFMLIICAIPLFITNAYTLTVCILTFYLASASLAWSVLGGLTGQISLGHSGFMGLGAYISMVLLLNYDMNPWITMVIAFFVVGALVALLLAPCFNLHGPYFSLVTIAFCETFRNLFTNWALVGKGQGLLKPFGQTSFLYMRFTSKIPYFYISLAMVVCFYIALRIIDRSKLGYALKTIREDEDTANAIGIDPWKYKVIATFISAGMVAIAGVFYAHYIKFIEPDIMMHSQSVEFILPAVIGGIGSVTGPLVGAVIIQPLSQFLNATFNGAIALVIYALILILVIILRPDGIMGWFDNSKLKVKLNDFFDKLDGIKKEEKGGDA